ncbi:hypothetical protein V8E55_006543 [Tylopilus felleus]
MNKRNILAENGGLDVELEPEAVYREDDAVDGEEGHTTFGRSVNSLARRRIWRWVHESQSERQCVARKMLWMGKRVTRRLAAAGTHWQVVVYEGGCTRWMRTRHGKVPLLCMNKGIILAENGGLDVELEAVHREDDVVDGEEGHTMSGHSRSPSARHRV